MMIYIKDSWWPYDVYHHTKQKSMLPEGSLNYGGIGCVVGGGGGDHNDYGNFCG
jgi:hypothetical protein